MFDLFLFPYLFGIFCLYREMGPNIIFEKNIPEHAISLELRIEHNAIKIVLVHVEGDVVRVILAEPNIVLQLRCDEIFHFLIDQESGVVFVCICIMLIGKFSSELEFDFIIDLLHKIAPAGVSLHLVELTYIIKAAPPLGLFVSVRESDSRRFPFLVELCKGIKTIGREIAVRALFGNLENIKIEIQPRALKGAACDPIIDSSFVIKIPAAMKRISVKGGEFFFIISIKDNVLKLALLPEYSCNKCLLLIRKCTFSKKGCYPFKPAYRRAMQTFGKSRRLCKDWPKDS